VKTSFEKLKDKKVFVRLLWFDEVAKRVSKEHEVEVRVKVADDSE
jgi:hypothetical protein